MGRMTPEQESAVSALQEAARAYRRTEALHGRSRIAAIAATLDALRAGVAPAEVERQSPFTGSYIRRLAREAGIPADERYIRD